MNTRTIVNDLAKKEILQHPETLFINKGCKMHGSDNTKRPQYIDEVFHRAHMLYTMFIHSSKAGVHICAPHPPLRSTFAVLILFCESQSQSNKAKVTNENFQLKNSFVTVFMTKL